MRKWGNWAFFALVLFALADWLWPFGFRFKRWQYRNTEVAIAKAGAELSTRFPPGSDLVAAIDFLERAGAECRDQYRFMSCRYSHFRWLGAPGGRFVMVWTVDVWHDLDAHVTHFAIRRELDRP